MIYIFDEMISFSSICRAYFMRKFRFRQKYCMFISRAFWKIIYRKNSVNKNEFTSFKNSLNNRVHIRNRTKIIYWWLKILCNLITVQKFLNSWYVLKFKKITLFWKIYIIIVLFVLFYMLPVVFVYKILGKYIAKSYFTNTSDWLIIKNNTDRKAAKVHL